MRRRSAALALALLAGCYTPPNPDAAAARAGGYAVDPAHATVALSIGHLGLSRYPAWFPSATGRLAFDPADPGASALAIEIAAASVDLPDDGLERVIEGPDWLDAARAPVIRFVARAIEVTGPNAGRIAGDLTLRGVTRPVTLDARFNGSAPDPFSGRRRLGFSATATVDRFDFGMTALPGFVGQDIEARIEIEFLAEAE